MSETDKEHKLMLNLKQLKQQLAGKQRWLRRLVIVLLIPPVLFAIVLGMGFAYAKVYKEKVYPGVYVANYALGSLTAEEVKNVFENINNRYAKEGITLVVVDKSGVENKVVLNPIVAEDSSGELWNLESDALIAEALQTGREGSWLARFLKPLYMRAAAPERLATPLTINETAVRALLEEKLSSYEDQARNARVRFPSKSALTPTVDAEQMGSVFNYDAVMSHVTGTIANLSFSPVTVELEPFMPTITKSDIEAVTDTLEPIFAYGNITLTYTDATTKIPRQWNITPRELANWISVERDSEQRVIFVLDTDAVKKYLDDKVRSVVDNPAQEARFVMEEGKVKEFQGSKNGLALNSEKTFSDIDTAFRERNYNPTEVIKAINLTVDIAEPTIKTADVNTLGITEVVGVGVSSFRGSPPNRIRNISNAVKRLNGILIKPGEEFSTNKHAGPYTPESGYLPELVIKGREIKKEVGGGMCQIGTTLFRMAMNSGMPITERRNHSLVVNYYGDPVNGNPGTDATVYDPLIDFKFLNDTGNYLLLQTNVDYKKQELVFTLWGKPDGRSGSYTHPKVSRWIPAGEKQIIEVDTLKPGETQCQHAYRGAVASFTYTRFTSSSEKILQVFDSYYRPLPEICMVGKAAPTVCAEGEVCTISPTPVPTENIDTVVPTTP